MKRIMTIQDISCLGKCSLTVALPIVSAFGIETCVVPTAVLSTHTQFKSFTFRDLTCDLNDIKEHWQSEGFEFDAIYTGYLGSEKQLEIVENYFKTFKRENNLIVVDPVMADNGKLYKGFTLEFAKKMANLCRFADIIVPNMTEASFMLDIPYVESGYSVDYIKNVLYKLTNLGCKTAILTGISFENGKIGAMGYNSQTGEYFEYYNTKVDAQYHGTGDIFSSALVGGLVRGFDMTKAIKIAADYTAKCIETTKNTKDSVSYGVEFEKELPFLINSL